MRPIDADALKELFSEVIGSIAKKLEMNGNLEHMIRASAMVIQMIDDAPTVQPERKGTRLSTVCLLCKKPAVTFNTEDDIPYTNYSYCEDCLRKGLKLLREQKKNLQTQPERKTGHWILDRSGAYCCSKCMEPCATYAMMKPRDKFCKMCGSRNEVAEWCQ